MKSSDPPFINPFVKSLLCQKNCLMRKGKIHQATSSTNQIRNISITSNKLSSAHSKRDHIYPCLTNPLIKSRFDDYSAFRPTGSPTSAIIYLTSVITSLLTSNKLVRLTALDFSKAFDTLNHSTLIANLASLQLDDSIHNLLISFF